ncbi:hypothetical protein WJX81_008529 [Elliptochloris bilobata]|uniref:TPM domain-containing protein n=1 Tax=Elliptochloris bilobata TaxID=381761 RepID=A0AAW1RQG1_9CHLO
MGATTMLHTGGQSAPSGRVQAFKQGAAVLSSAPRCRAQRLVCQAHRAQDGRSHTQGATLKLAAAGAAVLLTLAPAGAALANEFDLLNEPRPTSQYVLDDANVLNKTTKKSLNYDLAQLESQTGYRLEAVTVRKLEFENDAFAFGDKLVEKWYETVEQGGKKGVLVVVTTGKDGALTGGPDFLKAVGDELVDSIVGDNIPILTEAEKFNETVTSSVKRVAAHLLGQEDPGPPERSDTTRKRTYKTKQETDKTRNVTGTIVLTLLGISVVVPMLQYWGYTAKD